MSLKVNLSIIMVFIGCAQVFLFNYIYHYLQLTFNIPAKIPQNHDHVYGQEAAASAITHAMD